MPLKPSNIHFTRSHAILHVQRRLEEESFPRIQMTLIVALTGATGLLASFLLLRLGVDSMVVRYPLALAFAYLVFLFLLWLWLRTKPQDYLDVPDISNLPGRGSGDISMPFRGGGGEFGGGGASGSFDGPADLNAGVSAPSSSLSDAAGSIVDADEIAIPIVAVALAIGLAVACLYVIYIAPILFAELLVDGALSYALYRHLRAKDSSSHWLATACRRTVLPFGATAIFLAIVGAAMSAYAPGARSVGEVVHHTPGKQ
jgi:hypothetical protein